MERSKDDSYCWKITHVKVGYLIRETAPKSLRVYSATSSEPAA